MSTVDYHDFTDIHTPKEERRKLGVGDIYINAATCLNCGVYLRSKNRHDMVVCSCGNSVDGGSWYAKRSGAPQNMKDGIVMYADVESRGEA